MRAMSNPLPRSRPRRTAYRAALVAALLAVLTAVPAGCGGGGPRQTLERIASVAATARFAADELAARHTTARYTASTLDVLRRTVEQDAAALQPDELPPPVRDRTLGAVALARSAVSAMLDAARRRDTVALVAAADRVGAAGHTLDAVIAALPER